MSNDRDTTGANKLVPLLQLPSAEPKKVCWVQKSQDMDVSTSALGQLQPSPDLSCLSAEWQHTQEQRQQYAVQI